MLDALPATSLAAAQPDVIPVRCGGISAEPRWFCAQTHPQAERWAAANLRQSGYPVYLPMCAVLRRDRVTRSMTRPIEVPLFTGYLFAKLAPTEPWTPVFHTPGVARLVGAGRGKPDMVPAGLVEALQATEGARRCETPANSQNRSRWLPGAAVRLSDGAFAGHDAAVLRVEREVAVVALVCFGAMREAIVALDILAPRDEM